MMEDSVVAVGGDNDESDCYIGTTYYYDFILICIREHDARVRGGLKEESKQRPESSRLQLNPVNSLTTENLQTWDQHVVNLGVNS